MKRTLVLIGFFAASLLYPALPVFAADGFGRYTTGGAGGTAVPVTTAADLAYYVGIIDTPYIIEVSGTIDLSSVGGKVSIRSNKTIKGIGESPTIIGSMAFKKGSSNVIIERLNISSPSGYGEGDGISVKEDINNVFITKCTFYDCWDGCIDITRRSDWVTVSWCKFYFTSRTTNSNRVTLVGAGDSHTTDLGKLHVTFHHNWYGDMCMQRIPSVRFGRAHVYNNYYNCPGNLYCIWSRIQAECLIENNYFKDVDNPYYNIDYPTGKIHASGNVFENCTGTIHPGTDTVFPPSYSYTLDNAADVPAIVQNGAGADGNDTPLPHWAFGPYGDFDRSGIVDMNDLPQFVDYWLIDDCDQTANANYYDEDCIVNFREFALLASNWRYIPPDITAPAPPTGLWASGSNGTVSLDWNNNSEGDLAGYNIYRSTNFGSSYTKLNGSLLSGSDYIDNTVTNGTIYYYVVTAEDTSSNESLYSSWVSAIPLDPGNIIIQEDTTGFCNVDGTIETEHAGYTGSGFCDTENAAGNGIDWKISIPSDGNYTFTWRYAHGKTDDRSARLLVNSSEVISDIDFPPTGEFTTWSTVSVETALTAGTKDIRLEATGGEGLANIDYLKVTGENPQATSCP